MSLGKGRGLSKEENFKSTMSTDSLGDSTAESVDFETAFKVVIYDTLLMWKDPPPPSTKLIEGPKEDSFSQVMNDTSLLWKTTHSPYRNLLIEGPQGMKSAPDSSSSTPRRVSSRGPSLLACRGALKDIKKRKQAEPPDTEPLTHPAPMQSLDHHQGVKDHDPSFQSESTIEQKAPLRQSEALDKLEENPTSGLLPDMTADSSEALSPETTAFLDIRAENNSKTIAFSDPALVKFAAELDSLRALLSSPKHDGKGAHESKEAVSLNSDARSSNDPTGLASKTNTIDAALLCAHTLQDEVVSSSRESETGPFPGDETRKEAAKRETDASIVDYKSSLTTDFPFSVEVTSKHNEQRILSSTSSTRFDDSTDTDIAKEPSEDHKKPTEIAQSNGNAPIVTPPSPSSLILQSSLSSPKVVNNAGRKSKGTRIKTKVDLTANEAKVPSQAITTKSESMPTDSSHTVMTSSSTSEASNKIIKDSDSLKDCPAENPKTPSEERKERLTVLMSKLMGPAKSPSEQRKDRLAVLVSKFSNDEHASPEPETEIFRVSVQEDKLSCSKRAHNVTPFSHCRTDSFERSLAPEKTPKPPSTRSNISVPRHDKVDAALSLIIEQVASGIDDKNVVESIRVTNESLITQGCDKTPSLGSHVAQPSLPLTIPMPKSIDQQKGPSSSIKSTQDEKLSEKALVSCTSTTETGTIDSVGTSLRSSESHLPKDCFSPGVKVSKQTTSTNKTPEKAFSVDSNAKGIEKGRLPTAPTKGKVTLPSTSISSTPTECSRAQRAPNAKAASFRLKLASTVKQVLKALIASDEPDIDAARTLIVQSSNNVTTESTSWPSAGRADPINVLLKDIELYIEHDKAQHGKLSSTGEFLNKSSGVIKSIVGNESESSKSRHSDVLPHLSESTRRSSPTQRNPSIQKDRSTSSLSDTVAKMKTARIQSHPSVQNARSTSSLSDTVAKMKAARMQSYPSVQNARSTSSLSDTVAKMKTAQMQSYSPKNKSAT